jgi:hypothetical protein
VGVYVWLGGCKLIEESKEKLTRATEMTMVINTAPMTTNTIAGTRYNYLPARHLLYIPRRRRRLVDSAPA